MFAFHCVREYNALFVDPVPRFVSVFLLLLTQASVFASAAAQTKTNPGPPGAVVVGIICYLARKQPIGGWLLYYYISLYSGLALSFVLLAATIQNYSPERWQSTELYALAIESTALPQLALILQAVIATILLKRREWKWLKLLRAVLIGSVICTGITIVFDSVFFSPDQTVFDWFALIWLVIWLGYFFTSQRVKRVFFSKDWGANASPTSLNRAPVSTVSLPPALIPSLTPNTERPSLAASKPDHVFSQNTKTSTLIFFLCALAFCGLVILWEKYHTVRPDRPVAPEIRKAIPVQNQATIAKPLGEVSLPTLVKIVRPSVVQVIGYKNGKIVQTGSGFIAEAGAVVTNFHVVNGIDGAFIKLSNGSQKQVLGLAHYSEGADVAILLVREVDGIRGLSFAPSLPEVGERIYVLGNPETFTGTLSDGLVSAKRRDDYGALLQITAPISHGSSGSPVFDNGGLVVGVAMGSVESGQSLNFARSAGAVRAMLQSRQGFTTFGDLNKAQAEKERATAASDSVSPPRLPEKTAPAQELTQVYVKKFGRIGAASDGRLSGREKVK